MLSAFYAKGKEAKALPEVPFGSNGCRVVGLLSRWNPLHSKQRKTSQMLASTMARPKNGDPLPAMKSSFRRDESHMPHAIFALCRQAYKGAQAGTFGT